jgi:hypothetical protein
MIQLPHWTQSAKNMAGYINTYGGLTTNDPAKDAGRRMKKDCVPTTQVPGAVEASKNYAETNRYVKKIIDP